MQVSRSSAQNRHLPTAHRHGQQTEPASTPYSGACWSLDDSPPNRLLWVPGRSPRQLEAPSTDPADQARVWDIRSKQTSRCGIYPMALMSRHASRHPVEHRSPAAVKQNNSTLLRNVRPSACHRRGNTSGVACTFETRGSTREDARCLFGLKYFRPKISRVIVNMRHLLQYHTYLLQVP